MSQPISTMKVALPAWEIGRVNSGLGVKVGGLGVIIEELPKELMKTAQENDINIELEILTPCFAHYDKSQLTKLDISIPVTIEDSTFEVDLYQHIFPDGQKVIYFWDEWQLSWTNEMAIYPSDPQVGIKLYATLCQAMAGYIQHKNFDTVHLHDYHVGLVPFYLDDLYLKQISLHFTIHNATYQGVIPLVGGGFASLDRLGLPGRKLFHKYFDFFDNLNLMKACMLKVHENKGKITTVSGDLGATWGYAAELKESHEMLWHKAWVQKGVEPGKVFAPNRHLDLFEKLPIIGITNGMGDRNRPENLPELQADTLRNLQQEQGADNPIFIHPTTQWEMLADSHNFDVNSLETKANLKRLLHLEAFGHEPQDDPILLTTVGRLVAQKNLGLVADVAERVLAYDLGTKFIVLASASAGDGAGKAIENRFFQLAQQYPNRVYFNNGFNLPLSKLILAGGDFCLIPSRFEPCGLVDYEASLLGNIVIGRATGGLAKVRHCAYMYEWLDVSDYWGEANAFFYQIKAAVDTYRHDSDHHLQIIRTAMSLEVSWDKSAMQYIDMYRYGHLVKMWDKFRQDAVYQFVHNLDDNFEIFHHLFKPAQNEYRDNYDWQLFDALQVVARQ